MVIWLLGIVVVLATLGLLVYSALRVWRRVRRVTAAASELRYRAEALTSQVGELSTRLDAVGLETLGAGRRSGTGGW
jgi:hypothetical protein